MLPQERYKIIVQMLKDEGFVRVEDIMSAFNISIETVRRDLNNLEKEGLIQKTYGGARLTDQGAFEMSSDIRMKKNIEEKLRIGKKCGEIIRDGESVFLDGGTTTLQVAKNIKQKEGLTVITNSIYVINELANTNIEILVIGGKLRNQERAISGAVAMLDVSNFHVHTAVLGAGAISVDRGVSDYNVDEAFMRKKIIETARRKIVVADSSKFGFDLLVHVCDLSAVDTLITDQGLDEETKLALGKMDTELLLT